jgi:hypothetical protein
MKRRPRLPRLRAPLDNDDTRTLARLVLLAVLILSAAAVLGLSLHVFLWAAFGHW